MIAQFGDFEVDSIRCRLSRNGRDLRLGKQPLDLLIVLITRRDELVTREEIAAVLWGTATFVDSEHGINSAVRKIRKALGDQAESPKYIETVPRRGYRFVSLVTIRMEQAATAASVPDATDPAIALHKPVFGLDVGRRWPPRFARLGIGIASVLALAAAVLASLTGRHWPENSPVQPSWKPITKAIHLVSRLASDGNNVYWTQYDESGCKPWQVPVDGGADAAPVPIPFPNAYVTDATPDGRLLLIVRDSCKTSDVQGIQGPIWELTLGSGLTRRLGDLNGMDASYSPDSRRIALSRWDELWIANRDGSEAHRVAHLPGGTVTVHWSPDGKRLLFSLQSNTEWRYPLWAAEIESGKVMPFLPDRNDGTEVLDGAWTRDGQFVFPAKGSLGTDLWRLVPKAWPSSGHAAQQLTHGPLNFSLPVAIPGRSQLAVVGAHKQGELQYFDARIQHFVPFLNGISAEMVDFSRDGKWVAYVTYPERVLWRSRIDGSAALQLTHGSLQAGLPRISPDTSRVAFTGDYSGRELRTWIVPFNGGEPRPASQLAAGTAEVAPTWSPDGTKLLFRLDLAVQRNVLAILDITSGKTEQVPGSEQKFNQRWSPDGKWIVATPKSQNGLYLFNLARREWMPLAGMRADYPSWSRDSDYVYFCTHLDSGEEAIYRVPMASRKPERVTTLVGTERAFNSIYNQWVGLAPDNSPMILRSADLQQIYLLSLAGN